ncbi:MAG: DUF1573 domain-containing protein [Phycisphaerales bacterium]
MSMMSLLLVSSLVLGSAERSVNPPSPAPTAPPATAAAPAIAFSPAALDLGEMIAGKPKSGTVTVKNITGAPLHIEKVVASCGCTTVTGAPTEAVPAGGSFTLEITVDPGMKTGVDLAKSVNFAIEGAAAQSLSVRGHVKTVVRVLPDTLDASAAPEGAATVVTLESVDGKPFKIASIEPDIAANVPEGSEAKHSLTIDWKRWKNAGSPAKFTVSTDKDDAHTLLIPIKAAPAVVMFRVPAAPPESADRAALETAQDDVIHAIDASLATNRSPGFTVKLHREAGMLFVHGTDADVARVRAAIAALPPSALVHEGGQ